MTAFNLAYFLLMLLGMLAAIWKYMVMDPVLSEEDSYRRLRAGLPLLGAFMGVNFLSECIAMFVIGPSSYNHFIYATGSILAAVFMLAFYSLLAPGRLMKLYSALVVSDLIYFFISHSVWRPGTVVTQEATIAYFVMMIIGSLLFAFSCRRRFSGRMRRRLLLLAYLSVVYYLLVGVTEVLQNRDIAYDSPERRFLLTVNLLLAFVYYGGILFTVLRIPDKPDSIPAFSKDTVR